VNANTINLNVRTLRMLAERRKMDLAEVLGGAPVEGAYARFDSFAPVAGIAEMLCVPVSEVLVDDAVSDLDNGVRITRAGDGYRRTVPRNGVEYYTYHHLATTLTEPDLMPLRLELHCKDSASVELNAGHDAREVVYITKGSVTMTWRQGDETFEETLVEGDSVYLAPGVPHSFMTSGDGEGELLAFNCAPTRPEPEFAGGSPA
jgi:mannose-6-phosphate isomerase-like protein (cupin superfamily)